MKRSLGFQGAVQSSHSSKYLSSSGSQNCSSCVWITETCPILGVSLPFCFARFEWVAATAFPKTPFPEAEVRISAH